MVLDNQKRGYLALITLTLVIALWTLLVEYGIINTENPSGIGFVAGAAVILSVLGLILYLFKLPYRQTKRNLVYLITASLLYAMCLSVLSSGGPRTIISGVVGGIILYSVLTGLVAAATLLTVSFSAKAIHLRLTGGGGDGGGSTVEERVLTDEELEDFGNHPEGKFTRLLSDSRHFL